MAYEFTHLIVVFHLLLVVEFLLLGQLLKRLLLLGRQTVPRFAR